MALNFWITDRGDVQLVPTWANVGAPTSGTAGTLAGIAQPGDLVVDTTNKVTYQNTNTLLSPTWTALGSGASVAVTGGTINGAVIGGTTPAAGTFTTATATNLVLTGFADQSVAIGLTAVGTNRGNSLALTKQINQITVAASTAVGVTLPASASVGVGGWVDVLNDGPVNSFHVYAAGSDTIDGTAGATGVALTNAFWCRYLLGSAGAFVSYRVAFTRST